jgi:AcrR family transcriptional regulator
MTPKRRPLRADAQRNREHLLATAREVFAAEGLEVPIDEVARRAGLGVGTVYRHFPTKEALFEAIVVDQLEQLLAEAAALQGEEPARALLTFFERYLAAGAAKKDFTEALSRGALGQQPPPGIRKAFKSVRDALEGLLSRAQRTGAIRADVGVEELLALLHGLSAADSRYAGPAEGRKRLLAVVLDGLRRHAPA